MMAIARVALVILFLVGSFAAHAEIHKWIDENGKIHYGDRPPESNKVEQLEISVESFSLVEVSPLDEEDLAVLNASSQDKSKNKKVVMYSTQWCGVCKKAKAYFYSNNIAYREYDIEVSEKSRKQFDKYNGEGVPLILVGKQKTSGFSVSSFEKMYVN